MTTVSAVERFRQIAAEERFRGWPLVGEYRLGDKIPFFGQVLEYQLKTGRGVEDYFSLIRSFGWVVVFGLTGNHQVVTLVQWKPGVNQASWELPPGGIGRTDPGMSEDVILAKTQEVYLRETGFGGGEWDYLGRVVIETGKYRGAGPDDHGLAAHMFLATGLSQMVDQRNPAPNEIMETLMIPLEEFWEVIDSGLFVEASALSCALLALRKLGVPS